MSKLDTQGWIDATNASGQPYAFFVRMIAYGCDRDGQYKWTQFGGSNTIAGARMLAGLISREKDFWQDETVAKKAGLPSD
jgi:hypothetical protein